MFTVGQNVKVAMTQKGVTELKNASVMEAADGLVHVLMDGETVSVDPSQIVSGTPASTTNAARTGEVDADLLADVDEAYRKIAVLEAMFVAAQSNLDAHANAIEALQQRISDFEALVHGQAFPPAPQPKSFEQASTSGAQSGENAAGS